MTTMVERAGPQGAGNTRMRLVLVVAVDKIAKASRPEQEAITWSLQDGRLDLVPGPSTEILGLGLCRDVQEECWDG